MPIVQIEMIEGRSVEKKRKMVKGITEAIVEAIGCEPGAVRIIIRDIAKHNIGDGGELMSDK
ncbi:MAG: 4-oxalocrotonate tautomerase [Dethiobacteria bacterium]|nr:4-oxalocrotonate tautomerase [Bacillota bacterium]